MKNIAFPFVFACTLICSPAYAGELKPIARTNNPEGFFTNGEPEELSSRIASKCMDRKWAVIEQSKLAILCTHEDKGLNAIANLLGGNKYRTPPVMYHRFNIVKLTSGLRVQASEWTESQNAFGRVDRSESGAFEPEKILRELGGEYPDGTKFECCHLGVTGTFEGSGKTATYQVQTVRQGTAASEAGLVAGDKIAAINDKPVKDESTLAWRFSSMREGKPFSITIQRDGQALTLSAIAKPFPAAGTEEYKASAKLGKFDGF